MPHIPNNLSKILHGHTLSEEEMADCVRDMIQGTVEKEAAKSFLTALEVRGETAAEISGAAQVLRELVDPIQAPENAVDCCGTGGDGANTYNISTAVALVAAACDVPIAKHGNRSASSKSGAADVLEELGVPLDLPKEKLEHALKTLGFCFLMAPHHHKAMKNVAEIRKELGFRTIFNLVGPLANPAGTKRQLIGVSNLKFLKPMAEALVSLGTEKALVVHGEDGLDEITLTGKTYVAHIESGAITYFDFTPADFGLNLITPESIQGGTAKENAKALMELLIGLKNAYRDMVLANTAAVLFIHRGVDLMKGVKMAAEAIDNGKALKILEEYKKLKS